MPDYLVTWEINVSADDPVAAARQAWDLMRGPDSMANVFKVIEHDSDGEAVTVDLQEEDENAAVQDLDGEEVPK